MDINIAAMGKRIRDTRKSANISSEVLAEKIGIAVESLWHIENGARNTSLQTLCNIAEELNVSVDFLLGRQLTPEISLLSSTHDLTPEQTHTLYELCESMIPIIKRKV